MTAHLRAHGKTIRKRLAELRERLEIQLPVYLMITKADLVPGFEPYLRRPDQPRPRAGLGRHLAHRCPRRTAPPSRASCAGCSAGSKAASSPRMAEDAALSWRAEVFRFPAQIERLEAPLKVLVDTVFGESRYEEAPWLRGFYFTSATQEGSPIDRMLGDMAASFGLRAEPPPRRAAGEQRSYFLHDLLTEVIFPEAGLGQFDRAAEERRIWIWRGSVAAAAVAVTLAGLAFLYSFLNQSGTISDQARLTADLSQRLANVAARQAPTDPLDLDVALEAMTEIETRPQPGRRPAS